MVFGSPVTVIQPEVLSERIRKKYNAFAFEKKTLQVGVKNVDKKRLVDHKKVSPPPPQISLWTGFWFIRGISARRNLFRIRH